MSSRETAAVRVVLALLALALVSACASRNRVHCDGRLEPINPPASKSVASKAEPRAKPAEIEP
jgi:type IV pilus biogenesis protein CpaD/CtpE